jgi:hypothetical protein
MFPVHPPTTIRGLAPVEYQNLPLKLIKELRGVLDAAKDERPLQQFFEKHPAMLVTGTVSPHKAWVFPRPMLPKPEGGAWIPDFMICDWTSIGPKWTIIELESPTVSPLNAKGISGICRHAQQQIEDYRRHVAKNAALLRDGGWPITGDRSPAWIIIGRRNEQRTTLGAERLASLRQYGIEVASYDRIVDECAERARADRSSTRSIKQLVAQAKAHQAKAGRKKT